MTRLFVALLLAAAATAAGEKNLLPNGGFEKGVEGWRVLAPMRMRHELDKRKKKEGKQSLYLSKQGGIGGDSIRTSVKGIAPGSKVVVKAWFRAKDVKNTWFKVMFYDAAGTLIGQGDHVERIAGTFKWREIKLTNKAPKKTASAEVFVLMALGGELWIDNVRFTSSKGGTPVEPRARKPLDKNTRRFLDKHAIKVATLDFKGPLRDLSALKKQLKDVRIVQLGENTHGDGECFRAKARLVRYLHESCGFDIIAFESGLYECERANEVLARGKPADAMRASVFGIWRTEQVRPLFEYMAEIGKGRRPMRLTGFDVRGSGTLASTFLPELYGFLDPVEIPDAQKEALALIDAQLGGEYAPKPAERQAGRSALQMLRVRFDKHRAALDEKHGKRETAFMSHCLDNYIAREAFEFSMTTKNKGRHDSVNLRDQRMAANFRWLAEKRYPGQKIITWAATFHQAHNLKRVSIGGNANFYAETKGMGEYLHEWYGKQLFTIGFCAAEGHAGSFGRRFPLPEPKEGSFEDLLARYGEPFVIVPLRVPGPFSERMNAAPMAYGRDTHAPWPQVLDALFFIREMTPTTPAR